MEAGLSSRGDRGKELRQKPPSHPQPHVQAKAEDGAELSTESPLKSQLQAPASESHRRSEGENGEKWPGV